MNKFSHEQGNQMHANADSSKNMQQSLTNCYFCHNKGIKGTLKYEFKTMDNKTTQPEVIHRWENWINKIHGWNLAEPVDLMCWCHDPVVPVVGAVGVLPRTKWKMIEQIITSA